MHLLRAQPRVLTGLYLGLQDDDPRAGAFVAAVFTAHSTHATSTVSMCFLLAQIAPVLQNVEAMEQIDLIEQEPILGSTTFAFPKLQYLQKYLSFGGQVIYKSSIDTASVFPLLQCALALDLDYYQGAVLEFPSLRNVGSLTSYNSQSPSMR